MKAVCEVLGVARSNIAVRAKAPPGRPRPGRPALPDDEIVMAIHAIVADMPSYGYRRVSPELRHRGRVVNSKKVRRIMRENDLNPKRKRRHVVTMDSDHDKPIYPNLAPGFEVHRPNQLWVGDIT